MTERGSWLADFVSARRFSILFLALLGGFFALYLVAAVVVDPRGDFDTGRFPVVTLDSRIEKMQLFERLSRQEPVDGLIIGSSRSMEIAPGELNALTGRNFFNFAVDSANAEDYLAIYRWVCDRGTTLKVLLIGLDVEALDNNDRFDERLVRNQALVEELGERTDRPVLPFWLREWPSLASSTYATDILHSIKIALSPKRPRDTLHNDFDPDGLLHYPQWEKQVANGTFDLAAHLNGSREEYLRRFADMTALSPRRCHYLEILLQEARSDGVTVRLWITPIHPVVASYLSHETHYARLLLQTRAYVAVLGRKFAVPTFDFSAPDRFGGNNSDWWDGAHINLRNASHITRALAGSLRDHGL